MDMTLSLCFGTKSRVVLASLLILSGVLPASGAPVVNPVPAGSTNPQGPATSTAPTASTNSAKYDFKKELFGVWVKDVLDKDNDIVGVYNVSCADVLKSPQSDAGARSLAMICADPNLARQARIIQRLINLRQRQYAQVVNFTGEEDSKKAIKLLGDRHQKFLEELQKCDGNRNCILHVQRVRLCMLGACLEGTEQKLDNAISAELEKSRQQSGNAAGQGAGSGTPMADYDTLASEDGAPSEATSR